jgi:hypothetical protein
MKTPILKSIGAIVAGLALGFILSIATDKIFEKTGAMETEPFDANPAWLIMLVVVYRTIFNTAGSYLAARLAPTKPMKHALILGMIGLLLGIIGTIVMWDIPPHWYPILLVILTLPAAWFGGKLAMKKILINN